MNYRDVAIAVETEAQAGRWTAVLEGTYQKFDEMITSRSMRPWSVAWYIFDQGSDRQVRHLAALWLYRHERRHDDSYEPEVNPQLGTMLDQVLADIQRGKNAR